MNRRDFLKRSAGAAIATVAAPSLAAAAIPEAATTTAIVSAGMVASSWDDVATSTPLADFHDMLMTRMQLHRELVSNQVAKHMDVVLRFEPISVSDAEKTRTQLADLGFEEAK